MDQNTSQGKYQLGYGVVQLAAGATRKLDLTVVSRRICETLAEQVGETVDIDIEGIGRLSNPAVERDAR